MPPFATSFLDTFRQMPMPRRVLLGGLVVGVAGLLLGVANWASQPEYALLFGSLPTEDAGRVVQQLETDGVAYELRDGGASIYVPAEEVYGLRLRLATEGVVSNGPAGYELFDGGTLGMTDFMQRLNVKRALEGELARTIGSIEQVSSARVHLVLPERSPFRDQQAQPSASVVLGVRGQLSPEQIAGVTALVAGAVEGMTAAEVTVVDEAGRMLAGPDAAGGAGMSSGQLRMRQEVEDHLARSGQSMLDQLLGSGRAVVRVSAELDLARTETETKSVDPESQTMISEEAQEETGGASATSAGSQSTSRVRNYDLTRETVRAEREAGSIKVLTVSVLLDEAAQPADPAAAAEPGAPTPFTAQQIAQIESLVKNAVGFDAERGDRFAVQQIRFNPNAGVAGGEAEAQQAAYVELGVRYGLALLALFLAYRLLRGLARRLDPSAKASLPDAAATEAFAFEAFAGDGAQVDLADLDAPRLVIDAVDEDPYAARLSPEARERLAEEPALLETVTAHVHASPSSAAALVRGWLHEV